MVELVRFGKGTILSAPLYSPDGLWLAVPTSAGISLYRTAMMDELRRIPVATSFIHFSPDSSLLAAGGRGAVTLWDPATGAREADLKGSQDEVYWEVTFSPDGSLLAAVTWRSEVLVWSLATGQRLFTFPGDKLQFSPDGKLAVIVKFGEGQVRLYETSDGTEVNNWKVRNAGFAPGGQLWLEDDESVRLAYVDQDLLTAPFDGVQPAFSADGTLMALFANGQVSVYDHRKGRRAQLLEGDFVRIERIHFSSDGQTLAADAFTLHCPTCSEVEGLDRYLIIWRAADGAILSKIENESGWFSFSTDGKSVSVPDPEGLRVIRATDGSAVQHIEGFMAPVAGMALAPQGRTLAVVHATDPYTLRLLDLQNGLIVPVFHGRENASAETHLAVAYSPGGEYLAVRGSLWDLNAGEQLTEMEQAITAVTSCWSSAVIFAPKDLTLATGCFEGQLDLWSVPDGSLIERIGGYNSWVNDLAYSPDGNSLAAVYGFPDNLVQVWQVPGGIPAFALTGGRFARVGYSTDGRMLATVAVNEEYGQYGQQAGYVQLWRAADGAELAKLDVDDAVSLAFSPDSQILATGSLDGTLRLWELSAEGGRLLTESAGHSGPIQHLTFTPDGFRLISGSLDGTITLWGIPLPETF